MSTRCVVFDFDGTLTRVDDECVPYVRAYKDLLAKLLAPAGLRVDQEAFERTWGEVEAMIDGDPARHGWIDEQGRIVAPAYADPLIKSRAIAAELFKQRGLFASTPDRFAVLNLLFQLGYAAMDPNGIFRPEAAGVVRALVQAGIPVFVVTNSDRDKVVRKLQTVIPELLGTITVIGNARKFVVEGPKDPWSGPDAVPETLSVDGLPRPVYLRRPHYVATLEAICAKVGCAPEELIVCGDIYELDLVLPAKLGARIHLVTRPPTPELDRRTVQQLGGTVSDSLEGLLSAVGVGTVAA